MHLPTTLNVDHHDVIRKYTAFPFEDETMTLSDFKVSKIPKLLPVDKSALVQVMACRLLDTKPLPEPMLTQFTDAYT